METNVRRIERRLKREGWYLVRQRGGHDIYRHPVISGIITGNYLSEYQTHLILDTSEQMSTMVRGADGKRLTYAALIGPKHTRQPRML